MTGHELHLEYDADGNRVVEFLVVDEGGGSTPTRPDGAIHSSWDVLGGADEDGRFPFAGPAFDSATGLFAAHWRSYDPTPGRWLDEAPAGG